MGSPLGIAVDHTTTGAADPVGMPLILARSNAAGRGRSLA